MFDVPANTIFSLHLISSVGIFYCPHHGIINITHKHNNMYDYFSYIYHSIILKIQQQNIEHIFFFMMLDTAFYREKLNENRFVIFIYYECRYAQFALSSTTIYLWLISLTASKELSILLLKLLKCMEQSVYRLIHLGLRVRYRD